MSGKGYLNSIKNDTCPNPSCGVSIMDNSEVDINDFVTENADTYQVVLAVKCLECDTSWKEVYLLSDVIDIKVEGRDRKEHYRKKS